MPIMKFDGYDRINGGVHRQAAPLIGPSSIIRHLGVWTPAGKNSKAHAVDVQKYLETLRDALSSSPQVSGFDRDETELDTQPDTRGQTFLFSFNWNGLRSQIRTIIHTEYTTVTAIIDGSLLPPLMHAQTLDDCVKSNQVINRFKGTFESLYAQLESINKLDKAALGDEAALTAAHHYLYSEFWDDFERDTLDLGSNFSFLLGDVFADFRGIVTAKPRATVEKQDRAIIFERPFYRSNHERGQPHDYADVPDQWNRLTLDQLLPFLLAEPHLAKFEFAASGFLDRRLMYISALGPPRRAAPPTSWVPVCYYCHAWTDDAWQIGRLIDRLNYLGGVRLAAIIKLDALQKAGAALTDIDVKASKARELIQSVMNDVADGQIPNYQKTKKIREYFNEIQSDLTLLNNLFEGDMDYRIERSRYYVLQFRDGCKALRSKRIEGYQPYEDFVQRRLGGAFNYIEIIASRNQATRKNLASLYEYYTAQNLTVITDTIRRRDGEIESIQTFGEIILLLALLPYYLASNLLHMFEHPSATTGAEADLRIWWLLAVTFSVALTTARLVRESIRKARDHGDDLTSYLWRNRRMFAIPALIILLTVGAATLYVRDAISTPSSPRAASTQTGMALPPPQQPPPAARAK